MRRMMRTLPTGLLDFGTPNFHATPLRHVRNRRLARKTAIVDAGGLLVGIDVVLRHGTSGVYLGGTLAFRLRLLLNPFLLEDCALMSTATDANACGEETP